IRQRLVEDSGGALNSRRDLARAYGWMADTQLDLGITSGAETSYKEAAKIREEIIGQVPADRPDELLDALCQRARDFGNLGNYREWTGRPEEALAQYRLRDRYYQEPRFLEVLRRYNERFHDSTVARTPDQLPGEFRTDRANCWVTIADLQLDLGEGKSLELLERALAEYKR